MTFVSALAFLNVLREDQVASILCEELGFVYLLNEEQSIEGDLLQIIPPNVMKLNQVLPLSQTDDVLFLGMVNPLDDETISEISRIIQQDILPAIITENCLHLTLKNYFNI